MKTVENTLYLPEKNDMLNEEINKLCTLVLCEDITEIRWNHTIYLGSTFRNVKQNRRKHRRVWILFYSIYICELG